ncbi:hypothetical protein [Archangium violaceum]|nr:hypothetical protein [Archangium violaceum]
MLEAVAQAARAPWGHATSFRDSRRNGGPV